MELPKAGPASPNANKVDKPDPTAAAGAPAPQARGADDTVGSDASPSNTASHSYGKEPVRGREEEREEIPEADRIKVLRRGIDSLYLTFQGELTGEVELALMEKKQLAQSKVRDEQTRAQYPIRGHLFEVKSRGQQLFPYVLEDGSFRISLSSGHSRNLPFAYCKVSSDLLAHALPEQAEEELAAILMDLSGDFERFPTVSRVDLFVDFQTTIDIGAFHRNAWVTRAGGVDSYSRQSEFTGWVIGSGGQISARLYNKTLELQQKKHKAYLPELWLRAGMKPDLPVWRLEFQLRREVLDQLAVRGFASLLRHQGGIWAYASKEWLRLTVPVASDSNRGRWPMHPMWEQLSDILWRIDEVPLRRTYSPARIPSQERLFRLCIALLISFMAIHGITDYREGLRAFQGQCEDFHRRRCEERLNSTLEDWVALEVRTKGRQFNSLRTVPSLRDEAERSDEVARDAIDYNNASRGE